VRRILILTQNEDNVVGFKQILKQFGFSDFTSASSASDARQLLSAQEFDLCILNSPLADEYGDRLASETAFNSFCQVIMIVKAERLEEIRATVEESGVFTIPKPFNRDILWSAIRLTSASYNKIARLKNKNMELHLAIENIKRVDMAKCCLMEHEKMSEESAHKYIEKKAMNQRVTKQTIADEILSKYHKKFC
jgi:response regulator NasT